MARGVSYGSSYYDSIVICHFNVNASTVMEGRLIMKNLSVKGLGGIMIPDAAIPLINASISLGREYQSRGYELALVGGPVRDLLLGRVPKDLDMTSNARPDESSRILMPWGDGYWEVGRKYGTIGARRHLPGNIDADVEVTTYRSDSYNRGSRKPRVEWGSSLEDDLKRRDMTINAMAIRLPDLVLVDPYGGREDLRRGVIRTPLDPKISFGEDPLRMLRAIRFVGKYGFKIEDETMNAIRSMTPRLDEISRERVADELNKIMLSANPSNALREMSDSGLMDHVLPELSELRRADRSSRGLHKANFEHSLTVLDRAISMEDRLPDGGPDLVLRLAAVLHDVGKTTTRRFNGRKKVTFDGHEAAGAGMVKKRLSSLRYPHDVIRDVSDLVALHMRAHGYADPNGVLWSDSGVRRFLQEAGPLYDRLMVLTRADVTTFHRNREARIIGYMDQLEDHVSRLKAQEDLDKIRPELNGNQMMSILGIKPGPVLGVLYDHMLEYRMSNGQVGEDGARVELVRFYNEYKSAQ